MTDINRIRWACRRGMLECDLFLLPFVEGCYAQLSPEDKAIFERLLTLPDQTLHRYFMQQESPDEPEFQHIMRQIQAFHNNSSDSSALIR